MYDLGKAQLARWCRNIDGTVNKCRLNSDWPRDVYSENGKSTTLFAVPVHIADLVRMEK